MKFNIFIALFILLFASTVNAQSMKGDTITIFIENKVELKIAIKDYNNLKDSTTYITKHLDRFQTALSDLTKIDNGLKVDEAEKLTYIPNQKIVLEKIDKKEIFQLDENNIVNTGFRDEAVLNLNEIIIYLKTDNLSGLEDINLKMSVTNMVDSLPEKSRYSSHQFFQFKNNEITVLHSKKLGGNSEDLISLSFDAGANLIRNKLVGDIEFRLGLQFSKKGFISHSPYASLSLLYDFPSSRKTNINMFLNAGYDFYEKNEFNIGLEYGYLVRRQGDFFEQGTSRFGLKISSESKLNLTPYIYVNKGFKSAYPGVRLGINF